MTNESDKRYAVERLDESGGWGLVERTITLSGALTVLDRSSPDDAVRVVDTVDGHVFAQRG